MFQALKRRTRNGDRSVNASRTEPPPSNGGPTIGVAFGGGAARGFAHVGVLRTLMANGIHPDVVVGTSIGAVVAGCYAGGELDAFEDWSRGLTTRGVLSYLDISLSGASLISGGRLAARLEESLGDRLIEELPQRFAAIATEVGTGHEIWLTRGKLVEALRASYALPGIFAPVNIGGRWLFDGALVNPVPISAARALGARVVIGVNLNADLYGRGTVIADPDPISPIIEPPPEEKHALRRIFTPERLLKRQFLGGRERPGISTVMIDAFNVMQDRITRARLAGDPPDALISPRLGNVGLFDFHRASETIALGAQATERQLEVIQEAIALLA